MIGGFNDKKLEKFWLENITRGLPSEILTTLSVKLHMIAYSQNLDDLLVPPANRLEKLKGNLAGFYSIRVNRQWRLIFRWKGKEAIDLQLIDYHK